MGIVDYSADEADYIGDGEDGCYYQVAESYTGWFVTVVVDCGTSSFVEDLTTDDGPYMTKKEAEDAGRGAALDWCVTMGVDIE